jgi:hypothetical protein
MDPRRINMGRFNMLSPNEFDLRANRGRLRYARVLVIYRIEQIRGSAALSTNRSQSSATVILL